MPMSTQNRAARLPIAGVLGLAWALPASAGTPLDRYLGSADGVSISGVVDVPLYSNPWGGTQPSVLVEIGGKPYLFKLSTSSHRILVGPRVVADNELEAKVANKKLLNLKGKAGAFKDGGEFNWAEIDSIKIGDVELTGVVVATSGDEDAEKDFYEKQATENTEIDYDGTIGLGALPQLSWAILPSQGVVKLAPAAQGAELVKAVGGKTVSYTSSDSRMNQFGEDKTYLSARELVVTATVAGQSVSTVLDPALNSWLSTAVPFGDGAPVSTYGDISYGWVDAKVGDSALGSEWIRGWSQPELWSRVPEADIGLQARLGWAFLNGSDLAADTAGKTIALAPAKTQKRADPLPELRKAAEQALADSIAKADEAPAEGDGPAADPDAPKGDKAAYERAANLAWATGDFARTVELRKQVVAFDEDDCTGWLSLGNAQVDSGDLAAGISSLAKASELSHSWWDLTLDERTTIIEDQADDPDAEGAVKVQQPSCHVADGKLAAAKLANGEFAEVERIYRAHLDLDANLAVAWGAGALASGKTAAAQEPFRQALKMDPSVNPSSRLGLALLYDAQGDWQTAKGHFERALVEWSNDPMTVQLWLDAVRRAEGAGAVAKAATAFAKAHPDSPASWISALAEAKLAADEAAIAKAIAAGDAWFAAELQRYPRSARVLSSHARFLFLAGRLTEASAAADAALKLDPGRAQAWLVKSDVAAALGNTDDATAALRRAGQSAPLHPGYAMILGQL